MSLLSAHDKLRVEIDPFPHVVVRNAFPAALYEQLQAEFPPLETFTKGEKFADSTKIYRLASDLIQDPALSAVWRRTIAEHCQLDHFLEQYALFRDCLLAAYPDFEQRFGEPDRMRVGYEVEDDFSMHDLLLNTTLTVHTPNRHGPATDRGVHIKVNDKPILGHLMFPHPDDSDEDGGLELYAWSDSKPLRVGHHNVVSGATVLKPVKVVPYQANTLVLFLNTPTSVQAWQVRGRSEYPLRYMHFVSQVGEPLFPLQRTLPARARAGLRRGMNKLGTAVRG